MARDGCSLEDMKKIIKKLKIIHCMYKILLVCRGDDVGSSEIIGTDLRDSKSYFMQVKSRRHKMSQVSCCKANNELSNGWRRILWKQECIQDSNRIRLNSDGNQRIKCGEFGRKLSKDQTNIIKLSEDDWDPQNEQS